MKKIDKDQLILIIIMLSVAITGAILLLKVDWRIALGVFLMMWGNNISQRFK